LTPICTKSFVGWRFAPDPTGGAYSASPDPLAVFRGPTSKERVGERRERGEEGRESNRRGGDWKGGGDEGGSSSFHPLPQEKKRNVGAYAARRAIGYTGLAHSSFI